MKISIIVAVAKNGVIGSDAPLWHLGSDIRFFKKLTTGYPVIMGRKTYESIGRILPGRTNIILTKQIDFHAKGCLIANNTDQVLEIANKFNKECFVIGGSETISQFIDIADDLYLTEVEYSPIGNITFFYDRSVWQEVSCEYQQANHQNDYNFKRIKFERIKKII